MRRTGQLLKRIVEPENLRLAYWKAARSKLDRLDARVFGDGLDAEIAALRDGILNGDLPVGRHRFFTIHDPKKRTICAACFRERVLHHAIMNLCEPVFDRVQIRHSYACRKGRGRTVAVRYAAECTRRNLWFLHLDVHKYYDSIQHDILKALLRRIIKDESLLLLLGRIIDAYEAAPGRGLPIGHLTSQHFGNYYLAVFDHYVKEHLRVSAYMRYMDDMAFWSDEKRDLIRMRDEASSFLGENLALELNPKMPLNRTLHGCNLLGYRIFPHHIRLSRRSATRFRRGLVEDERRWHSGEWSENTLIRRVEPKFAFVKEADSLGFRNYVLKMGMASQARTA